MHHARCRRHAEASALRFIVMSSLQDRPDLQLSIVVTSRNDDHGGTLLYRMQHFIDGLIAQCERHRLRAELILVEWNPPEDRPPLVDVLNKPAASCPVPIRVITVPPSIHARFAHADKLPLFQMIAKNAGIRRARGRFVLATNIDILFSDNIIRFMRESLRDGHLYRVDRCDVPPAIPAGVPFAQTQDFCEREMFRIHKRGRTLVNVDGRWIRPHAPKKRRKRLARLARRVARLVSASLDPGRTMSRAILELPRHVHRSIRVVRRAGFRHAARSGWHLARRRLAGKVRRGRQPARCRLSVTIRRLQHPARRRIAAILCLPGRVWQHLVLLFRTRFDRRYRLHTNACGDFTLLSREDWFSLRGYPEWEIFSWHIDSVLLHQAVRSGIVEVDLPAQFQVYHIEHGIGSGYTPEGADALFSRLEREGIPYLDWPAFLHIVADMDARERDGRTITYNLDDWGLGNLDLLETSLVPAPLEIAGHT